MITILAAIVFPCQITICNFDNCKTSSALNWTEIQENIEVRIINCDIAEIRNADYPILTWTIGINTTYAFDDNLDLKATFKRDEMQ